jgi:DNA-binding NarL/FixJ family response regulator
VTTVLLVDDQDLVRAGFRIILQSEPGIEVVGEASNGADGIRLARELNPDVICMDVQMPGLDGLSATRAIVAEGLASSVLILTTFDRDDYLFEALTAGASGFLLKTASPEDLVDAVQVLARGDALLSPTVTRRVIERFSASAAALPSAAAEAPEIPARPHPALEHLTERETEVLALLSRGRSNGEIATELFVGEATVKTHVSNVLAKIGVRDRTQAVIFAYETGIVTTPPPTGGNAELSAR